MAHLTDLKSGKPVQKLKGHLDYSFAAAWHPEGNLLATGNQVGSTALIANLAAHMQQSAAVRQMRGFPGCMGQLNFQSASSSPCPLPSQVLSRRVKHLAKGMKWSVPRSSFQVPTGSQCSEHSADARAHAAIKGVDGYVRYIRQAGLQHKHNRCHTQNPYFVQNKPQTQKKEKTHTSAWNR